MENLILSVLLMGSIYLVTQRWFWAILGVLGALSSFFAMCASVIGFQILFAMGFFFLMIISVFVYCAATDS